MDKEKILSALAYDADTGVFTWKISRGGSIVPGKIAGCINDEGYRIIGIFGRPYKAHRLAFIFMTGDMPPPRIPVDHIDGNRDNNRWVNLRAASLVINNQNQRASHKGSKSGLIGAHWNKAENKWQSAVKVNKKNVHIGYFDTAEDAHLAYVDAKRKLHEGCTI